MIITMITRLTFLFLFFVLLSQTVTAQEPRYTYKHFVSSDDPKEFVRIVPEKDGFMRTYLLIDAEIWDVDDSNTTYVTGGQRALVCIEGSFTNGKREGVYTAYVLDSLDHKKRYRIYEQTYMNDQLNGEWRVYTLAGNLVKFQTYRNDTLHGLSKVYWIDGKTLLQEYDYINGEKNYVLKEYAQNGKISQQTSFINKVPNGPAKRYYPDGTIQDEVILKDGEPDGLRRYYYPSGKIWVEQEMRNGSPWTVIANYTEAGIKRDPGTLKEGNGTVKLYNDDGTLRETILYKNGAPVKP
ncbi:hypothetical protein F5148DRAFT_1289541 [Russula earlei]|uniref:Uncharacterized protein n=1 Tax=Russula earlei TaxID=71964 RepID=A0ACC0TXH8_9AGAM|nr:hypothetical protein F5148DRAFT_1289541 [Russula earlei]